MAKEDQKKLGTSAVGSAAKMSLREMADDIDTQRELFSQHRLSPNMLHTHYILVKKDGTHQLMKRPHPIDFDLDERGNRVVIAAMEHTLGERLGLDTKKSDKTVS